MIWVSPNIFIQLRLSFMMIFSEAVLVGDIAPVSPDQNTHQPENINLTTSLLFVYMGNEVILYR